MGLYWLCNTCGTVFTSYDRIKTHDYLADCPEADCSGKIFECDEQMIYPIDALNRKGYTTRFCCGGHIFSHSKGGYINFVEGTMPDTVPKGWYKDECCIRYDLNHIVDIVKRHNSIHWHVNSLIKWCDDLPDRKEESK